MAICDPCKEADHKGCEDFDPVQAKKRKPKFVMKKGRLYRSCDCQHGGKKVFADSIAGEKLRGMMPDEVLAPAVPGAEFAQGGPRRVMKRRSPQPPASLIEMLESLEWVLNEAGLGTGAEALLGAPQEAANAQAVNIVRDALIALRMEPDNHHNAAKCPYCSP